MKQHKSTARAVAEWDIDEPVYGFGPLDPFKASYEVEGKPYDVSIQGFFKDDDDSVGNFRYRVSYLSGETKILSYVAGLGFVDQDSKANAHTKELTYCINQRFSQ